MTTTTEKGTRGEDYVCSRLGDRAMTVLARNVREKFAEIDIVARQGEILCFVEVRTRRDTLLGHPSETINATKQRNIRRAAEAYLIKHDISGVAVRFDVATIVWEPFEFLYFENAF